jgi:FkbM family methyltransferase
MEALGEHCRRRSPVVKFPFRLLSRSRYQSLKRGLRGKALIDRLQSLFDPDGAEPKLLRASLVAEIAAMKPAVVLDIGANVGLWTTCLSKRFPWSVVHAVEADPRTAATLRRQVTSLSNVAVHEVAIHSSDGRISFRSHENPLLSSVIELDDAVGATKTVEVEAIRLDQFVRTRLPSCPALVKIDTEGNDMQVLAGGKETLADPRLRAIIMEFGFDPSTQRQVVLQRLLDVMAENGFRLRELDLAGIYNDGLYGNAMFCRFGS